MFDSLPESQPVRERKLPQTVLSILIHTGIFAAAIHLTRAAAQPGRHHTTDLEIPLIAPHEPPPPPSAHSPQHLSSVTPSVPSFLTVTPPLDIPNSIPRVDMSQPFNPNRYTGIGAESNRDIGLPMGADSMAQSDARAEVDTPAEYVSGPTPKFPSALRTAGIEGSVVLRFVVGPDGRVEPGSVHVMESTNRAFEEPAIAAVTASTFKPGRIRGRSVRQVVEQAVRFQLSSPG